MGEIGTMGETAPLTRMTKYEPKVRNKYYQHRKKTNAIYTQIYQL